MALADVTLPKLPTRFDRVLEKVRLLLGGKPEAVQVAALPWRRNAEGRVEILMATSRDTGRWVTPKGWPMANKAPHEVAEREAFEEAGIKHSDVDHLMIYDAFAHLPVYGLEDLGFCEKGEGRGECTRRCDCTVPSSEGRPLAIPACEARACACSMSSFAFMLPLCGHAARCGLSRPLPHSIP